ARGRTDPQDGCPRRQPADSAISERGCLMIISKGPSPRGVKLPVSPPDCDPREAFLVKFSSGNAAIVQMFAPLKGRGGRGAFVEEWMRKPHPDDLQALHDDLEQFLRPRGMPLPDWTTDPDFDKERSAKTLMEWLEQGIPPK